MGTAMDPALAELLVNRGLRRTSPRMAILRILEQAATHLSVAELRSRAHEEQPTINMSTVYRNVSTMRECGVLHSVDHAGETLFGLVMPPHHHLVCERCGVLVEIPVERLDSFVAQLATRCGFDLNPTGQVLHGRCRRCQTGRRPPTPSAVR
ncbi:Fur family transcriptional regulator [Spongiactinospora sp. TRM90649]|uniref:Fur family transcriptional regulator n=1 Tax=Spongiactinospora sp. TRM90649 TaxID=3031114 RepID=UPI0023F8ADF5|nr:Fur family transcriptional regulator [Spongiactinospora sp. TRM90649]MDF5756193.1 Fur family transcriptional regulator [Spongiactinospora sp. TRM90649]